MQSLSSSSQCSNLRRNSSSGSTSRRTANNNGGERPRLKIYNSLSATRCNLLSSSAASNKGIAWYICGPTVYDSTHIGHGRTYVTMDIIRRVALNVHNVSCENRPRPLFVMNITDVDDKIIQRSLENATKGKAEEEADPIALARKYECEFWQDLSILNVMKPDVICRVSEHVTETIVPYIQQIVDGGMAYVIPEEGLGEEITQQQPHQGSIYFDVRAFESKTNGITKYGKLAPDVASTDFFSWEEQSNDAEENSNDEGESIRKKKRDSRDFCLWKYRPRSVSSSSTNNTNIIIEPSSVSYASPWGPGRPGWHVECSAMIQRLSHDFQSSHIFGIHAGGVDLKFPHHSNEIAQAEAYTMAAASDDVYNDDDGRRRRTEFKEWIPHWIHTGHLHVKGRKMSKSLKNFITIREMLCIEDDQQTEGTNPATENAWSSPADDFRLWCLGLSGSYRGPATYSKDRMEEARVIREKWVRFLLEGQECLERMESIDTTTTISTSTSTSRLWGDAELQLFHTVTQCSMNCRKALLDDLDGASFVKELTLIAETGLAYVEQINIESNQNKSRPEEPLRFVLDTLRGQLDLVGFAERTVNVGIDKQQNASSSATNTALIDETVAFRATVRSAALGAIQRKKKGASTEDLIASAKETLGLCDELRDNTFPKLGIELLDGKVVDKKDRTDDVVGNSNTDRGWRYCSPRE